ncbi:epithelial membrane protein 1 [Protopterus annectens]|uniref:epithelial membrane protein 1 n=1 Tax=Protopterus annectens TaxID=7888 RepID=UPI001CFA650A|nr:epithelial membrane protein 1 [Protopterus annectens]
MLILLALICVLHVATIVMLFVSTIDSSWYIMGTNSTDIWKKCIYVNNSYSCVDVTDYGNQDYLRAVQALMILAVIFSCFSIFSFLVQLFTAEPKRRFFITGGIHMLCCLCVMCAASIYTAQFPQPKSQWTAGTYGYSYILAWICFCLSFINSIIYCVLRKKGDD